MQDHANQAPVTATTVTVSYSRVHSLLNYNNVKPGLSITVDISEGQDVGQVVDALNKVCRGHVEDQIDAALMGEGQPPKFYDGPRFKVLFHSQIRLLTVVPQLFDSHGLHDLGWNAGAPYGAPDLGGIVPHQQPFTVLWPAVFNALARAGGRWLAIDGSDVMGYGQFLTEFERVLENIGAVQIVDVSRRHFESGLVSLFSAALPASPLLAGWDVDDDESETWHCKPIMLSRSLAEALNDISSVRWFNSAEDLDVAIMDGSWAAMDEVQAGEVAAQAEAEIPF